MRAPRRSGSAPRKRSASVVALDELHHQRADAPARSSMPDGADVRMVERGEHPRFTLESRQPLGIGGSARENLDGHFAPEPGVAGALDLAHAAGAEPLDDLVRPDVPAQHGRAGAPRSRPRAPRPACSRTPAPLDACVTSDSTSSRSASSPPHASRRNAARSCGSRSSAAPRRRSTMVHRSSFMKLSLRAQRRVVPARTHPTKSPRVYAVFNELGYSFSLSHGQ